jgi:hypothetical protein
MSTIVATEINNLPWYLTGDFWTLDRTRATVFPNVLVAQDALAACNYPRHSDIWEHAHFIIQGEGV